VRHERERLKRGHFLTQISPRYVVNKAKSEQDPKSAHISRHLPRIDVGVTVGSGAAVGVDVGVGALVGESCGVGVGVGVGVEVDAGGAVGPVCGYAGFAVGAVGAAVGTNGTGIVFCPTGVAAVA
jgi:hypothetical protein